MSNHDIQNTVHIASGVLPWCSAATLAYRCPIPGKGTRRPNTPPHVVIRVLPRLRACQEMSNALERTSPHEYAACCLPTSCRFPAPVLPMFCELNFQSPLRSQQAWSIRQRKPNYPSLCTFHGSVFSSMTPQFEPLTTQFNAGAGAASRLERGRPL